MALLPTPPSVADEPIVGLTSLQQGNLLVSYDAASGFITATRVSDGVVLLQTVNITWGAPAAASRPNSVSANITCVRARLCRSVVDAPTSQERRNPTLGQPS